MKLTLAKLAVAITAVAGVVAGVSPAPASAFSETNTRCPGTVQVPTTNGYNFGSPSMSPRGGSRGARPATGTTRK